MFVCILPGKAVPKITYTVSGVTLNPTHSLTHCISFVCCYSIYSILCPVYIIYSYKENKLTSIGNIVLMWLVAALTPNIDHYVFVKIVNDVAGIVLEEDSGDAGYD